MEYLSFEVLNAILTGLVIGGLINITGVGGGVLIIPALVLFFSLPITVAVGTASLFSTLTKIVSSINHIISKTVNWKVTLWFLVGAVPTTILSALSVVYMLQNYPEQGALVQQILRYFVIGVMLFSVAMIYFSKQKISQDYLSIFRLIFLGAIIGVVMAYSGIGGGVLIIPALALSTSERMKSIVSCSIVIAVIISMLSGIIYAEGGQISWNILIGLLVGSAIGIPLSNPIRHRLSNEKLTQFVLLLIVISAGMMLFS
jgi:uncharacterized membrane protein YfcA